MLVLAAAPGRLQAAVAVLLAIGLDPRLARADHGGIERCRHKGVGEQIVGGILRERLSEIDEVPIEIDAFLGDAAEPSEAVGIDRVEVQDSDTGRQAHARGRSEPIRLRTRAAEALDPVRRGDRHQEPLGIRRSL